MDAEPTGDTLDLELSADEQARLDEIWSKRERRDITGEIEFIRYHSRDGRAPELPAMRGGWQQVQGGFRRWSFPIHQ